MLDRPEYPVSMYGDFVDIDGKHISSNYHFRATIAPNKRKIAAPTKHNVYKMTMGNFSKETQPHARAQHNITARQH